MKKSTLLKRQFKETKALIAGGMSKSRALNQTGMSYSTFRLYQMRAKDAQGLASAVVVRSRTERVLVAFCGLPEEVVSAIRIYSASI